MWEFRNRNVFGATAFGTYGGFWIGLGLYVKLVAPEANASQLANDQGWILLAFAIFNAYMLIASLATNKALFAVFLTLQATEILLFIGLFAGSDSIVKIGGYVGVLTALVAWYTSFAGVLNTVSGRDVLKIGSPMLRKS
jgi:succinate-acetate transporter protein